tara:strand:+ start:5973 stop:6503 length:531 start_codon:yes stop_codon:yes gene_type:complete
MNKFFKILLILFFVSMCSNQNSGSVATIGKEEKISEEEQVLSKEDHPKILTDCLRDEGYQIQTPFDLEDMKETLDNFTKGMTREGRIVFQEDLRICIQENNLWSDRKTLNPEVMAELYDNNVGLAQCLRDKGVDVADPTQENPKVDLSNTGIEREELKEKLEECDSEGWRFGRGKK